MMRKTITRKTFLESFLYYIECVGNKIPHPMMIFVFLSIATIVLSGVLASIGFSDIHPVTGKTVLVNNLLTVKGLLRIITNVVKNFVTLPAVGMVLTCMLGVGVCDRSGLFAVSLKHVAERTKGSDIKIIAVFIFCCVMADCTGGTGFVVMPPLGALIFQSLGRNPIAGMLCAYGTTTGAFASNLLVTSMDVINVSFTETAAKMVDPSIVLSPAINYYYSAVSTIILLIVSLYLTVKVVEPRLGKYTGEGIGRTIEEVTDNDRKALKYACVGAIVYLLAVGIGTVPFNGILRDPITHSPLVGKAPLMQSLPLLISLLFFIPGCIFGIASNRFKGVKDIANALGDSMADMGPYIALMFIAAQFLNYFSWTNIGIILAIKGAHILQASGLPIMVLMILFITMSATINLLIGSDSTKWAILSPIFVPMFMFLGYHPALTQMAYRIGDAITNPLCPTFAYFAMLLALVQKYDKKAGLGTLMANMFPFTLAFYIFMIVQLLVWVAFNWPLGPGGPIHM